MPNIIFFLLEMSEVDKMGIPGLLPKEWNGSTSDPLPKNREQKMDRQTDIVIPKYHTIKNLKPFCLEPYI